MSSDLANTVKNAFIYGYKTRFLHAATWQIMSGGSRTLREKIRRCVVLGVDHGKVLAVYALIYRVVFALVSDAVKDLKGARMKQRQISAFVAGAVGGALVYGGLLPFFNDRILVQITLYTLSRTLLALGKYLAPRLERQGKVLCSAAIWGTVMLFYDAGKASYLQTSMRLSMDFIYGPTVHSWLDAFRYGRG